MFALSSCVISLLTWAHFLLKAILSRIGILKNQSRCDNLISLHPFAYLKCCLSFVKIFFKSSNVHTVGGSSFFKSRRFSSNSKKLLNLQSFKAILYEFYNFSQQNLNEKIFEVEVRFLDLSHLSRTML